MIFNTIKSFCLKHRTMILVLLWLFWIVAHFFFLILWALAFDGCTKCFNDAAKTRSNLISSINEIHVSMLLVDMLIFLPMFLYIYHDRKASKRPALTVVIVGMLYTTATIDFWGLNIYGGYKCGKDCDPIPKAAEPFQYFGYACLPSLLLFLIVMSYFLYRKKSNFLQS